jgi:hypothetical protein
MSDSTKELLETAKNVLFRCWILGFVVLFIWLAAMLLMGDMVFSVHGSMFGLTEHELQIIHYCGMGLWKLAVFACFFIPWLSIKMVLKKS